MHFLWCLKLPPHRSSILRNASTSNGAGRFSHRPLFRRRVGHRRRPCERPVSWRSVHRPRHRRLHDNSRARVCALARLAVLSWSGVSTVRGSTVLVHADPAAAGRGMGLIGIAIGLHSNIRSSSGQIRGSTLPLPRSSSSSATSARAVSSPARSNSAYPACRRALRDFASCSYPTCTSGRYATSMPRAA